MIAIDSIEHQKAVLSTLCLSPNAWYDVKTVIAPNMFQDGKYRDVADLIWSRMDENKEYDLSLLNGVAGSDFIYEITSNSTSKEMLGEHAQRLHDAYMSNQMLTLTNSLLENVSRGEAFSNSYSDIEEQIALLRSLFQKAPPRTEIYTAAMNKILEAREKEGLIGVPSGWSTFDSITSGFQKKTSYVFGARPGMGKSTTMCVMVCNQIDQGFAPVIFSLGDWDKEKIIHKLASIKCGISHQDIRGGNLTDEQVKQVEEAIDYFYSSSLEIFDVTDIKRKKVFDIADKIRDLRRAGKKVDIAFVDYIQQLKPKSEKRNKSTNDEGEEIAEDLQYIASLLNMPIVIYSQLSRAVETRGGTKRPMMSDLRNSGGIEQAARNIYFIYRPEYYDIMEDEQGYSLEGITEIIVAKDDVSGTGGDKGSIILKWQNQMLVDVNDVQDEPTQSQPHTIPSRKVDDDEVIPF
jgi:replicative DNA helicase